MDSELRFSDKTQAHLQSCLEEKLGIISPLNNSNGSLNVSHNDGNDVKIPTMKNIPTLRTAQFLN